MKNNKITKELIRNFAEETMDYVTGGVELERILKALKLEIKDQDGLGGRINEMHQISDNYDIELLAESKSILEDYLI